MFLDREDAARQLASALRDRGLERPVILAIPRGGVVVGATLARELNAELDVILSRKLRAPFQPELAVGAISETGEIYFDPRSDTADLTPEYLKQEQDHQLGEIRRRQALFRAVRPQVPLSGRCVVVTDDGIATGSTIIAALQTLRSQRPKRVVVAVPVAPADRLEEVSQWCDEVVCLLRPQFFFAIGQFYEDFRPVEDEEAQELLRLYGCPKKLAADKP
jgi:putative phosphoribosyl transferase